MKKYKVEMPDSVIDEIEECVYFIAQDSVENALWWHNKVEISSHGRKRFVIAVKYKGEQEYRYIVASNLSWRTIDIVEAYSLRWLVEVFIQD